MVWSEITQSEWPIPDYTDWREWIPNQDDLIRVVGMSIVFTIMRVIAQKIFLKHAKSCNIREAGKYAESCWKALFYTTSFIWGLFLVYQCECFPQTTECWRNYPNIPITPELRSYYLYELAFYLHSLYAHLFIETLRSDFWALFFHHLISIYLIYYSYLIKFHKMGLLFLVCHDTSDVLFEIGKTFVYREWKKLQDAWFILILVSWLCTRLGIYPFMLLYSGYYEAQMFFPIDVYPLFYISYGSTLVLLALHVYWFALMLRMAVRHLRGEPISDTREEVESKKIS